MNDKAKGQTISEKALAAVKAPSTVVTVGGREYAVKQVTLRQLKQKDGETVFVRFLDKWYIGKDIVSEKAKKKEQERENT